MRSLICGISVVWSVFIACPGSARAEDGLPYFARVAGKEAIVRSGPSEDFYVTDRLSTGTEVEVFRHDKRDWAAIRPPQGSSSWISAESVQKTEQPSVGRVTRDGAQTRIGTVFGDDHRAAYIKLDEGELVEILERRKLKTISGTSLEEFYRIMPPAGEFRWISLDELIPVQPPPKDSEDDSAERDVESEMPLAFDVPVTADDKDRAPPSLIAPPETKIARWTSIKEVDDEYADVEAIELPDNNSQSDGGSDLPPPSVLTTGLNEDDSTDRLPSDHVEPADHILISELANIELKLSETIIDDPDRWNLGSLQLRSQAVIDTGEVQSVREDAQRLLAKITQFADIKRRSGQLKLETMSDVGKRASLSSSLDAEETELGELLADVKQGAIGNLSKYDGEGWLRRVVSNRRGVPEYALTDRTGNIIQFISPQTGLDLGRYERKRVGIFGVRGFIPEFDRPHLVAQRIVSLDKVTR